jgi:hypothetical protein
LSHGGVSDADFHLSFHPKPGLTGLFALMEETIMANYYEQTVVQQTIPDADMTPLERLLRKPS